MRVYLFWKNTTLGGLLVSQEGICEFVNSYFEKPFRCTQATLSAADGTLFLVVAAPKSLEPDRMTGLESRLREVLSRMGFSVRISWVEINGKPTGSNEDLVLFFKQPFVWAVAFALFTLLLKEGLSALIWSLFWGGAFFAAVMFLRSEKGSELIKKLRSMAGR